MATAEQVLAHLRVRLRARTPWYGRPVTALSLPTTSTASGAAPENAAPEREPADQPGAAPLPVLRRLARALALPVLVVGLVLVVLAYAATALGAAVGVAALFG